MANRTEKKIKRGLARGGVYKQAAETLVAQLSANRKKNHRDVSPFLKKLAATLPAPAPTAVEILDAAIRNADRLTDYEKIDESMPEMASQAMIISDPVVTEEPQPEKDKHPF